MDDLFGSSSTSTTTSEPFSGAQKQRYESLWPYLEKRVYNPRKYNGQLTAPINPTQQGAIANLSGLANSQFLQDTLGGKFLDPESNPNLQKTIDIMGRKTRENFADMAGNVNTLFNKNSFWGGSAHQNSLEKAADKANENYSDSLASLFSDNYNRERANQFTAQGALQSAAQAMLGAGNTAYQIADNENIRRMEMWLKEQGMEDQDISAVLQYLGLGKNPTQTTNSESLDMGDVTGTLAGFFL
jgi:hypothetical protein